jgi:translocation and assembly module TamB
MLATGEIPHSEFSPTPQQRASRLALFLGKNLLSQFGLGGDSERLSVRSGESISETGKTTYDVEYKLSRRWYLVGEYDRFNAFNFGLRWKIYSK